MPVPVPIMPVPVPVPIMPVPVPMLMVPVPLPRVVAFLLVVEKLRLGAVGRTLEFELDVLRSNDVVRLAEEDEGSPGQVYTFEKLSRISADQERAATMFLPCDCLCFRVDEGRDRRGPGDDRVVLGLGATCCQPIALPACWVFRTLCY